jgi:hypothetical protein
MSRHGPEALDDEIAGRSCRLRGCYFGPGWLESSRRSGQETKNKGACYKHAPLKYEPPLLISGAAATADQLGEAHFFTNESRAAP